MTRVMPTGRQLLRAMTTWLDVYQARLRTVHAVGEASGLCVCRRKKSKMRKRSSTMTTAKRVLATQASGQGSHRDVLVL